MKITCVTSFSYLAQFAKTKDDPDESSLALVLD